MEPKRPKARPPPPNEITNGATESGTSSKGNGRVHLAPLPSINAGSGVQTGSASNSVRKSRSSFDEETKESLSLFNVNSSTSSQVPFETSLEGRSRQPQKCQSSSSSRLPHLPQQQVFESQQSEVFVSQADESNAASLAARFRRPSSHQSAEPLQTLSPRSAPVAVNNLFDSDAVTGAGAVSGRPRNSESSNVSVPAATPPKQFRPQLPSGQPIDRAQSKRAWPEQSAATEHPQPNSWTAAQRQQQQSNGHYQNQYQQHLPRVVQEQTYLPREARQSMNGVHNGVFREQVDHKLVDVVSDARNQKRLHPSVRRQLKAAGVDASLIRKLENDNADEVVTMDFEFAMILVESYRTAPQQHDGSAVGDTTTGRNDIMNQYMPAVVSPALVSTLTVMLVSPFGGTTSAKAPTMTPSTVTAGTTFTELTILARQSTCSALSGWVNDLPATELTLYVVRPRNSPTQAAQDRDQISDATTDPEQDPFTVCLRSVQSGAVVELRTTKDNVGPRMLLSKLAGDFRHNSSMVAKISRLETAYSGFRRMRGDGNCYFRAAIFGLLESIIEQNRRHLFRELHSYFVYYLSLHGSFITEEEVQVMSATHDASAGSATADSSAAMWQRQITQFLQALLLAADNRLWATVDDLEAIILRDNKSGMDDAMIRACRRLVSAFLMQHKGTEVNGILLEDAILPSFPDCHSMKDYCLRYIDCMGVDAEGPFVYLGVIFCALRCFGLMVLFDRRKDVVLNFFETDPSSVPIAPANQTTSSALSSSSSFTSLKSTLGCCVHLLLRPGHYDLLKPVQPDRQDGHPALSCDALSKLCGEVKMVDDADNQAMAAGGRDAKEGPRPLKVARDSESKGQRQEKGLDVNEVARMRAPLRERILGASREEPIRDHNIELQVEREREIARERELARGRELALERELERERTIARERELALESELARQRFLAQERHRELERERALAQERDRELSRERAVAQERDRQLALAQDRERQLSRNNELERERQRRELVQREQESRELQIARERQDRELARAMELRERMRERQERDRERERELAEREAIHQRQLTQDRELTQQLMQRLQESYPSLARRFAALPSALSGMEKLQMLPRVVLSTDYPHVRKCKGLFVHSGGLSDLKQSKVLLLRGTDLELRILAFKAFSINAFRELSLHAATPSDGMEILNVCVQGVVTVLVDCTNVTRLDRASAFCSRHLFTERGSSLFNVTFDMALFDDFAPLLRALCTALQLPQDCICREGDMMHALNNLSTATKLTLTLIDGVCITLTDSATRASIPMTVTKSGGLRGFMALVTATLRLPIGMPLKLSTARGHLNSDQEFAALNQHDVVSMHCCSMCRLNTHYLYDMTNNSSSSSSFNAEVDTLYSIGSCNHTACGNCLSGYLQRSRVPRPALAHEPDASTPTVLSFHSFPSRPTPPLPADCEPDHYLPLMVSTLPCPVRDCVACISSEGTVNSHSLVVVDFYECLNEMASFINHLRAFRTCALYDVMFCDEHTHVGDLFQLGCGHFFHHACMAGYLRTEVETARASGSQTQIMCYKCKAERYMCSCLSCDERIDRGTEMGHIFTEQEVCSLIGNGLLNTQEKDNWSRYGAFLITTCRNSDSWCCAGAMPSLSKSVPRYPGAIGTTGADLPLHCLQRTICPRCRNESHVGITCDKLAQRKRREQATAAGIAFLQQCPNCPQLWNVPIDCFHVTCDGRDGCGQQFCFLCGASHTPTLVHGNWYHRPGCSYYNRVCGCVTTEGQLVCLATDPLATCVKSKYWPEPCDPCIAAKTINTCTHGQNNWRPCNICISKRVQCKHYCHECRKKGSLCTPPGNPPDLESDTPGKLKFELFERQAVLDEQNRLSQQNGGGQGHGH